MVNKTILLIITTIFIANSAFSLKVQKNKPGKVVEYKKYGFKLRVRKDYKHSEHNTKSERIKSHRWQKQGESVILEIRCARDFVHLHWHQLLPVYKQNTVDLYTSIKVEKEKSKSVLGRWVRFVHARAELKKGGSAKVILLIIKNKNTVYFVSIINSSNSGLSAEIKAMVNSLEFL